MGPTGAILMADDKPAAGVGESITTRLVNAEWNGECGQNGRHRALAGAGTDAGLRAGPHAFLATRAIQQPGFSRHWSFTLVS